MVYVGKCFFFAAQNQLKDYYNKKPVEFVIRENYELVEDKEYVSKFTLKNVKDIANIPINEPIKFVKLERGEKEELNRKFNYSIDYNQIYDTKFITIPIDTVLFNNGDKLNREKRIKEFIEKYISQQYYTFSEPLLLKDENYCYFEYEIGSFFSPHSIRKQTLFKKIDGKWKEWIVISFQHTF